MGHTALSLLGRKNNKYCHPGFVWDLDFSLVPLTWLGAEQLPPWPSIRGKEETLFSFLH